MTTRHLFLTLTAVTICFVAFGQHDIGLSVSGGLSKLTTDIHSTESVQTFYFVPSGCGELFYNLHLGDKSVIGTELLFSQIEGKEYLETPEADLYGNPTGQLLTFNIWRHISYLSVPIYYKYNYKKLNVNIGLQTSFTLASSARMETNTGYSLTFIDDYHDKLPIKMYDFGARAGLCFALTKKFSIEMTYYYGLTNIYKYSDVDFTYTVQQMTVGLHYKLFSLGGQTSETKK